VSQDAEVLAFVVESSLRVLPELQEEYDAVMHELAEEQAVVAEIENCDQVYLEELTAAIAKQKCVATHCALVRLRADSPTVPHQETRFWQLKGNCAFARS
jgi:hypothetical protein